MNWYQTGSARVYCGVHESVVGTFRTSPPRNECPFLGQELTSFRNATTPEIDPGCVKTLKFKLRVEIPFRFVDV